MLAPVAPYLLLSLRCGGVQAVLEMVAGMSDTMYVKDSAAKVPHVMHGKSKTHAKEYRAWKAMKGRCGNPRHASYAYYGGRGITVCDGWKNNFEIFILDMGACPPGLWLERKDNNKGYRPDNCCRASIKEQANNKRKYPTQTYCKRGHLLSEADAVLASDGYLHKKCRACKPSQHRTEASA